LIIYYVDFTYNYIVMMSVFNRYIVYYCDCLHILGMRL